MSLTESFNRLKKLGYEPKSILDIGAYHGDWTRFTQKFFPNASFTMIEANDHLQLKNVNATLIKELLSSSPGDLEWWSNGSTGDSIFLERTHHYDGVKPIVVKATTLDLLFKDKKFDFVKIDTQGSEIEILKGGVELIKNASVILLECPFAGNYNKGSPSFSDYIQYMDSIGFTVFDITEIHTINIITIQIDIIFIKKGSIYEENVQSLIR